MLNNTLKRVEVDQETLIEKTEDGTLVINEGIQHNGYFCYNPDATTTYPAAGFYRQMLEGGTE